MIRVCQPSAGRYPLRLSLEPVPYSVHFTALLMQKLGTLRGTGCNTGSNACGCTGRQGLELVHSRVPLLTWIVP